MLTYVQKETLQTLINLYQSSNGKSIKGGDIAEAINRNPGTIRNQMISLRRLGLVKSVPGPDGGYKPTIEAYHSLNISVSGNDYKVPIYNGGKRMEDVYVATIEFSSVAQVNECEVAVRVLGSIKDLNLGDEISVGPTPVNNLGIIGTIVGRDDLDNVLLVDSKAIRSIPKKTVGDIANNILISLSMNCPIKEAAKKFAKGKIYCAPVLKKGEIMGVFTLNNLADAIAKDNEYATVGELMSTNFAIVDEDLKVANAIEMILKKSISTLIIADNQSVIGMITKIDLMESIINLKQFPIL